MSGCHLLLADVRFSFGRTWEVGDVAAQFTAIAAPLLLTLI